MKMTKLKIGKKPEVIVKPKSIERRLMELSQRGFSAREQRHTMYTNATAFSVGPSSIETTVFHLSYHGNGDEIRTLLGIYPTLTALVEAAETCV